MSKTIKLILFISIGVGTLIYYRMRNWRSKSGGAKLIEKIKNDVQFAGEFSKSLDMEYATSKIDVDIYRKYLSVLPEGNIIANYIILLVKKINHKEFLLITLCEKMEYNITASGSMGDLKKVDQLNFRLDLDESNGIVNGYSDIYENLNDKNIRTGFLLALFQDIKRLKPESEYS